MAERGQVMNERADIAAALAELEFVVARAIRDGDLPQCLHWRAAINPHGYRKYALLVSLQRVEAGND